MHHPLLNEIVHKLNYVTTIIEEIKKEAHPYLSLDDAAGYLCISKSTLYKHTSDGIIPFYKPNGKLILFSKTDLDQWIEKSKVLSNSEIIKLQS